MSSNLAKFLLIPGAPVLLQKLQELEVPAFRSVDCCCLVPRDALLPEELENIPVTTHSRCFRHHVHCTPLMFKSGSYGRKVASLCCQHGCLFIPGAAFLHCVGHHLLVPALRCVVDCADVPRATLGAEPLQRIELSTERSVCSGEFVETAAMALSPLQNLDSASLCIADEYCQNPAQAVFFFSAQTAITIYELALS
jgi:hypothetical protein